MENRNTFHIKKAGVMADLKLFATVLLLLGLFVLNSNPLKAQWAMGASSEGFILPDFKRPVIEARILNDDGSFNPVFYPGSTRNLQVLVENKGNKSAVNCWLSVESGSAFIRINTIRLGLFTLEPGESKIITLPIEVLPDAPIGIKLLTIMVQEDKGYNMFPARNLNIIIGESPDYEMAVTDFAIRDQSDIRHFIEFQPVEIFFRIQNCSFETFQNVNAQLELHPSLSARQVNPNYRIGTLNPGEYRDIRAVVATTLDSENISIDVNIKFDDKLVNQNIVLDYRVLYKRPEEMLEDGCNRLIPAITDQLNQGSNEHTFNPHNWSDGKFAIVIGNEQYYNLDNLEIASNDAREFANFLINYLGYKPGNVLLISNILMHELRDLGNHPSLTNHFRNWRRKVPGKELTFYFVGYGSTDLFNGDVFLLPSNFTTSSYRTRVNLNEMYDFLNNVKRRYDFNKISAYFNIIYAEKSLTGNKKDDEFSYVSLQKNYPGITTLKASSHHHSSHALKDGDLTLFTSLFMQAMKGAADLNNDGRITSFELYRYISDEFQGLPARAREKYDTYSVPLFFGEDIFIY